MYGNGTAVGGQDSRYATSGTSAPPQQISPLQEVMLRQERDVETLHDRIGQVEMRLEGVLLPTVPTPANRNGADPAPAMSQHHVRGSVLADRIEQAIARLEDLLHRLQV